MPAEETKHDLFLKRVQVTVAILGGLATLISGAYNIKKNLFSKEQAPEIKPVVVLQQAPPAKESPIKAALEDAGASWIRKAAQKYTEDGSLAKATQN